MPGPYRCARALVAALALCLLAPVGSALAQEADADVTVDMLGLAFSPTEIHVPLYGTVLWINTSPIAHTVTSDDGLFDSGSVDRESAFSATFYEPGTYQYFCEPHGAAGLHGMAGVVIVDDPEAPQ